MKIVRAIGRFVVEELARIIGGIAFLLALGAFAGGYWIFGVVCLAIAVAGAWIWWR